MFLTQPDYFAFIKEVHLQQVIEANEAYKITCELIAQEEIASNLRERYDVDSIFAETGTDRNQLIVYYMVICTLHYLLMRVNLEAPKKYADAYAEVKVSLERISAGQMNPNLPRNVDADDVTVPPFVLGSNQDKITHSW